ncbi:MAG: hypothetical protein Kow00129_07060 [Thermoleophilia bacterium]
MNGLPAETFAVLVSVWLGGGIVLGLAGYLSTLWGFATLMRVEPVTIRIPTRQTEEAGSERNGFIDPEEPASVPESALLRVGRQNAGLVLLSAGLALILAACALEGYVFALLVRLAAA